MIKLLKVPYDLAADLFKGWKKYLLIYAACFTVCFISLIIFYCLPVEWQYWIRQTLDENSRYLKDLGDQFSNHGIDKKIDFYYNMAIKAMTYFYFAMVLVALSEFILHFIQSGLLHLLGKESFEKRYGISSLNIRVVVSLCLAGYFLTTPPIQSAVNWVSTTLLSRF